MLSNVLAFDIETVPDVELGRRLHGLEGLSDKQVGYVMQTRQREETGSEFLSLEQHRIVAISVALRTRDGFSASSLGSARDPESELVRRFFELMDQHSPTLVSWNGSGFDLPVLACRALRHHVQAQRYSETGDEDPAFRSNNDLGRFHRRHVDLMDVLSGDQGRGRVRRENMAQLLGLPGKLGMSAERVWEAHLEGRIEDIRHYCETDVINTYLVYLRFELMRGRLDRGGHDRECGRVREYLRQTGEAHLRTFLDAWPSHGE